MATQKPIKVVPYNAEWPAQFEIEATSIMSALGENGLAIHHVGSTSVPELPAKPKIDILIVVENPGKAIGQLESVGYQYRGEFNILLHYGFSKRGDIDFNLHVFEPGHPEIALNLTFRDYLRDHPKMRELYGELKYLLISQEDSREVEEGALLVNYTLRKGDFIREALNRAGYQKWRVLLCNDPTEWHFAKKLRWRHFSAILEPDPWMEKLQAESQKHLILYRGAHQIGYTHVELDDSGQALLRLASFFDCPDLEEGRRFWLEQTTRWLEVHGYRWKLPPMPQS